jgi:glyoxylase-like metal-dependent hydrolase (beta-lactamase superfamily II)
VLFRETFPAGAFACNCTILACDTSKEAVVIDPGGEVEHIREIIEHHDLRVKAIIHTHAHLDHIHCTRQVKEQHGGRICLHKDDLFLYEGIEAQAAMFGWQVQSTLPVDHYLKNDETIEFGEEAAVTLHTPGHTPGSVCFEVKEGKKSLIFAGDTLFRRGVGRTDLPGGNTKQLLSSIQSSLYTRAPDALVVPGHGPNTTIEEEAAKNPFVTADLR